MQTFTGDGHFFSGVHDLFEILFLVAALFLLLFFFLGDLDFEPHLHVLGGEGPPQALQFEPPI